MEFSTLYTAFQEFFLGDDSNPGNNFFFSFHKGGYLLEDAIFQTENKAKENLSKISDCAQMFSQNLHYFSRIEKVFSSLYESLLINQAQAHIPRNASREEEETLHQEFSNCKFKAQHAFELFGELASEYGPTTYKPAQFEPLLFANDNQFWQEKEFTLILPGNTAFTTIAFEYVRVRITYPWFNESLVKYKSWYISDWYAGQAITQGIYAIPRVFIVIRKLKITGQWNSETIVTPGAVDAYSPFSYPGSSVPIFEERMQIAGWLFEKLPNLAPVSDPARQVTKPYSLLDKAPSSSWTFGQGLPNTFIIYSYLPWSYQINTSPIPQVGIDKVMLENHHTYTALRMWPPPIINGTIRGGIGPFLINSAATFTARFGFMEMRPFTVMPGIYIQVFASQLDNFGNFKSRDNIYFASKYHNGSLLEIDADLSRFIGKTIYIELNVFSGQPNMGAMAYWVDPKIVFF